ncbi:MAG TPA: M14 family zinc carboxypeptidase [Pyrinomonadaceae bacterium]|jgi:murein tripeptide amidase MpaA
MPYLNVTEVESALAVAAAAPFDGFTQLITLPELTWEGRQCHAIKLANGSAPGRPGVYFLGGIHAREWGSCDILINFVQQLETAYLNGTGITLGGKTFSAAEIKTIVDNLDIIVFPQANPDGRNFSMNTQASWRKNRRTAAPNSATGSCVGVDLNRNFDLLWDFEHLFAPTSTVSCSSDPCEFQTYHGPVPFSEPETRNAKWIHDNFPNIGFFIDLHSFGQDILYSWGIDDNQTTDPGMNFQNPAYNNVRGILDALGQPGHEAYREYIPAGDLAAATDLANTFGAGIQAVRGTTYAAIPSVGLYPTAGASDDYAYSRHFVDAGKRNVLSYTLEWGTEFQPPYAEMQNIIQEITSGLLAFCLRIRQRMQGFTLTTDRSTFGKDEVEAMLHVSAPARVEAAFYVVVDGFRHEELGITAATLAGVPDVKPTITFNPALGHVTAHATACRAEGNTLVAGPQRFTWTFAVQFDDTSDFTQEVRTVNMTAALTTATGVNLSAQALLTLTKQPNPYEIDGPVSWLAVDLQVCQVLANGSLPNTPAVTLDAGPNDFIQRLLNAYNDPTRPRAPNHPFDLDLVANQATSAVQIAGSVGGTPVYNFAVARVRYRALSTPAANVRVFFRSFQASTTSTEFAPATTYRTGGTGANRIPLLGVVGGEVVTIPFFAAPRVDPTNPNGLNAQTDASNVHAVPPDATGAEVQAYFGCWLDINQNVATLPASPASAAGPYTPAVSIQQAIRNKHQCLVAEINLDAPAPQVAAGATPAVSDKLAQRNLTVVGVASPHLVPNTFDVRPTAPGLPPDQLPDELMIDWGHLPAGTQATVYLPGVSAQTVLGMADQLYAHHELALADEHTISCRAAGVTYIPVPPGTGANYAGLLTLDVPRAVRREQRFNVVVRQITNAFALAPEPPPTPPGVAAPPAAAFAADVIKWRRVLGSFQVSIPVETREALLEPEERLLSVLRWIALAIPQDNRWYPVFSRYLDQVGVRVRDLGGDPDEIAPSPDGSGRVKTCARWLLWLLLLLLAFLLVLILLTPPAWLVPVAAAALVLVFAVALYLYWCCKT